VIWNSGPPDGSPAPNASGPVTFHYAFQEELKQIERSRQLRDPDAANSPKDSLVGLAFSGGGIRSATFNLGILQALAANRVLHKFDYLSTVSGGGYIGSWLAALTKRFMTAVPGSTFRDVETALVSSRYKDDERNEPTFLHWLRMYSNYLTPHTGVVSGDTWAMLGTWLRNVFLNQTILGLIFVGTFLLCHAALLFFVKTEEFADWFIGLGAMILTAAAAFMALNVVDLRSFDGGPQDWFQRVKVSVTVIIPFVLASILLNGGLWQWIDLSKSPKWRWWLAGGGLYFVVWCIARIARLVAGRPAIGHPKEQRELKPMVSLTALLISAAFSGALGGSLFRAYSQLLGHLPAWTNTSWIVAVFGSGVVMLILLVTGAVHLGLIGRGSQDLVREWWARLGGYLMLVTLGWILMAGICALGPLLVRWVIFRLQGWSISAGLIWVVNNYLGIRAAYSGNTTGRTQESSRQRSGAGDKREQESGTSAVAWLKSARIMDVVAKVAPYVFALGLILLLATAVHIGVGLVFDLADTKDLWRLNQTREIRDWYSLSDTYWDIQQSASPLALLGTGVLLLSAGLLFSWRVDVNDFSLHHFYRNRLVRCYLGASNPCREPQAFTGFDPSDDLPLKDFANDYPGPLPILNATLNLTNGENLGYATRRAKSFVFTPLYCGYDLGILGSGQERFQRDNGYQPSFSLAKDGRSKETVGTMRSEGGIGLGTAMAVSGAAASPNMGYFGSPATAFFMTLFDVRLGWWMGNPLHREKWRSPGPRFGISYLLSELVGQSDQHKSFVYLSDGGHFENLGVYELIKRRCKVIIACDAGCDPKYEFENMIALIEKVRTDFSTRIEIDFTRIRPSSGRESDENFVEGKIYYDPRNDKIQGRLIYIKASMPKRNGREDHLPDDVWNYFDHHKTFPHQSTADQWFDELQFESYRALGEHIGNAAAKIL